MQERSDYFQGMQISKNVKEFQVCIGKVSMVDMQSEGPFFTWSKRRIDGFVAEKLDKILIVLFWLKSFIYTPPDISYHYARWISTEGMSKQKSSSFKFFNFLAKHKDFIIVVSLAIYWCSRGLNV